MINILERSNIYFWFYSNSLISVFQRRTLREIWGGGGGGGGRGEIVNMYAFGVRLSMV